MIKSVKPSLWQKELSLSNELEYLSDHSKVIVVNNSNHCINETRPDAVIDSIKELLDI